MHPDLLASYGALERGTDNLLSQLGTLSEEQLRFRPDDDTWSLTEVVDHLALVEAGTVKGLAAGLDASKRKPRLRQRLLAPLLGTILRSPMRVKIPTEAVRPRRDADYPEAADRWRATRAELAARLETFGEGDMGTPVFLHPIAGPLTPCRVVGFLKDHLTHHLHQVQRLRDAPGFPAA